MGKPLFGEERVTNGVSDELLRHVRNGHSKSPAGRSFGPLYSATRPSNSSTGRLAMNRSRAWRRYRSRRPIGRVAQYSLTSARRASNPVLPAGRSNRDDFTGYLCSVPREESAMLECRSVKSEHTRKESEGSHHVGLLKDQTDDGASPGSCLRCARGASCSSGW